MIYENVRILINVEFGIFNFLYVKQKKRGGGGGRERREKKLLSLDFSICVVKVINVYHHSKFRLNPQLNTISIFCP